MLLRGICFFFVSNSAFPMHPAQRSIPRRLLTILNTKLVLPGRDMVALWRVARRQLLGEASFARTQRLKGLGLCTINMLAKHARSCSGLETPFQISVIFDVGNRKSLRGRDIHIFGFHSLILRYRINTWVQILSSIVTKHSMHSDDVDTFSTHLQRLTLKILRLCLLYTVST